MDVAREPLSAQPAAGDFPVRFIQVRSPPYSFPLPIGARRGTPEGLCPQKIKRGVRGDFLRRVGMRVLRRVPWPQALPVASCWGTRATRMHCRGCCWTDERCCTGRNGASVAAMRGNSRVGGIRSSFRSGFDPHRLQCGRRDGATTGVRRFGRLRCLSRWEVSCAFPSLLPSPRHCSCPPVAPANRTHPQPPRRPRPPRRHLRRLPSRRRRSNRFSAWRSLTRWSRRSRCIPIRCWRRC